MSHQIDLMHSDKSTIGIIWYLAWPAILEQVLITMLQYVDTAMVGSLGPSATAAIALITPANWLINGIMGGIAVGFSVPVGRYIGAKKPDEAKEVIRQSVIAIILCGLALTAITFLFAPILPRLMGGEEDLIPTATMYFRIVILSYVFNMSNQICGSILRCMGDTRTPLKFNVCMNCINMVLNFLLIYSPRTINIFGLSFKMWGAGLGVPGAAIATSISMAFAGTMTFRAMFLKKSILPISLRDRFKFDKKIWGNMVRLGLPVTFERVTISLGQIFMTSMVTGLGTVSLAAHSLAMTTESVTYLPAFGFSTSGTTLVAQSLGAQMPDKARKFSRYCIGGCVIFMTLMGFVLYFCGEAMMGILTPSIEAAKIGGNALKVEALAQPLYAVSMVGAGVLRGSGDSRRPFFQALLGMWCVRLPVVFLVTRFTTWGLPGAWIGMATDLMVRGIFCLIALRGGHWAERGLHRTFEKKAA